MSEPKASSDEGGSGDKLKDQKAAENEELARFREAWRAEVQHRKQLAQGNGSAAASASQTEEEKRPLQDVHAPSLGGVTPMGYTPVRGEKHSLDESRLKVERAPLPAKVKTNFTVTQVSAIEVYGRAVAAEEIGDLDTALQLYRTAFRKYDAVDRLWRAAESQRSQLLQNVSSSSEAPMQKDDNRVDVLEATVQDMAALSMGGAKASVVAQQAAHTASVTGILETVLADFPPMIRFELEELAQERSATIDSVPDEVLVKVLLHLNPQSIERFALVSRKGRVVTLDAGIWRNLAQNIYKPPQISIDDSLESILERLPIPDYRRLYISQPRVRLDGVYIAVCHYVRNGLSENAWVNMSHLVTYHRYIRFYPNGQVLSLLANEHDNPQRVIANLNLSLRMKGLSVGTWHIAAASVDDDEEARHDALVYIDNLKAQEPPEPCRRELKYHFQMTLSLRSRPLGRWNKLDFLRYASVAVGTGEITPFPLKHERPFWFSKVRSYGTGQNMEKELLAEVRGVQK